MIYKIIYNVLTKSFRKKNKSPAQWSSFKSVVDFPTGILPTKRQVIEQLLHEDNFLQLSAARIVANELEKRWLWCNIYCLHPFNNF